ncbi:MAG: thioredoxin-dependent thiol peroxidase [Crocinitomicaceae bacterium]|jgi:thioredoxin-dependent peroxiredoxin|nr:thioredoxin-dependent thiol peroxidase [Crocinitomicaceae bacterium]
MEHLKVGDKAPSWSGKDQNGKAINQKSYEGKKAVVYFYPKDNTPGCTTQACNIRDNWSELQKKGIEVIGVSADSEKSHQKFVDKFQLPFALVADEQKEMIETFGVWGEKKFMGKIYNGIHRTTFVLDETGTIKGIIDKPKTKAHTEEILKIFKEE